MKCLEKRPSDRYQSAAELADDLQHFQSGHAIAARPPSSLNRLIKWTKRRPAMAALIAVSLAAVFGLLGIWAKFTSELSEQTRIAREKTNAAQTSLEDALDANAAAIDVMDFFTVDLLDSANPDIGGANVKVVDVIDEASKTVETKFKDRLESKAIIQTSIGNMYFKLGQSLKALPHMERGVDLFEKIGEPVNQQSFVAQYQLAICLKDLRRDEEAFEIGHRITPLARQVRHRLRTRTAFFQS